MADDPVVVLKVRPVKSSNGMEDKTELTIGNMSDGAMQYQKSVLLRRGEVRFKFVMNGGFFLVVHKSVSYWGLHIWRSLIGGLGVETVHGITCKPAAIDCRLARTLHGARNIPTLNKNLPYPHNTRSERKC